MPRVIVVGAGVFGTWTAHFLLAAGHDVTLLDAWEPGHSRASSGDESRIIRCGYGPDEVYSRFARRSLESWRELDARSAGRLPLFEPCGVLWLAAGEDAYNRATAETLERGGYPVTRLSAADLRARYPHLCAEGVEAALFEPDCGVIMARRAVKTLALDLIARGVRVSRARVAGVGAGRPPHSVRLEDGTEVRGDLFVFACGAWLPALFPDLLHGVIRPTRQVVMYFGTPAGDERFGPAQTPAWVDFPAGIYGVPDLEGRGLKVGIDRHGAAFDPDTGDREIDAESVAVARAWLTRRFPAMADAPIVESRICQYENTSTGDFLIDRHPEYPNVMLVGGGSGHGFKHGPAVGEYVAQLVAGGAPVHHRFSLRTKATTPRRAVY